MELTVYAFKHLIARETQRRRTSVLILMAGFRARDCVHYWLQTQMQFPTGRVRVFTMETAMPNCIKCRTHSYIGSGKHVISYKVRLTWPLLTDGTCVRKGVKINLKMSATPKPLGSRFERQWRQNSETELAWYDLKWKMFLTEIEALGIPRGKSPPLL